MKKVAIYARISTADKGQDLDTQLIPLRDFVKKRGWTLAETYTDISSGAKESRPALNQLMEDAKKRKIDAVIVYRFDRFARSTKQLINSLELFSSLGVDFISYQEAIDTSTPTGKVMFTMISAFSELERSIISERVKSGLNKAKSKGTKLGRPRVSACKEEIVQLRHSGLSIRKIAEKIGISKTKVHELISC